MDTNPGDHSAASNRSGSVRRKTTPRCLHRRSGLGLAHQVEHTTPYGMVHD